jgi:proline dehydrogenase
VAQTLQAYVRRTETDLRRIMTAPGARAVLQRRLRDAGNTVRLYLSFGEAWWPYAVRHVGESPHNTSAAGARRQLR